ncbi:unnamed protein product [Mucor circinelloides]
MPFTKTFHGFIENTTDSLLIIEACRKGLLPTINRRLIERERSSIKSGTIIVFDETESGNHPWSILKKTTTAKNLEHLQIGIKRWTDGFLWSPSRILGSFLVYRELENRETRKIENDYSYSATTRIISDITDKTNISLIQQRERALVGSLTTSNTTYNFKKEGLIKKTIRIMVNGNFLHIVNYYNKHDALNNLLPTPSASPELACLQISADLMPHVQGQYSSICSSANTETTITNKRFKPSDRRQLPYQSNRDEGREYNINYSNLIYSSFARSSVELEDHLYHQPTLAITRPAFDATTCHYSKKRNKTSHDNLPPSLSPTPSPPIIVSASPSPSGDTTTLANRFNQFYFQSSTNVSQQSSIRSSGSSTPFDFTYSPRRTTAYNN